MEHVATNRIARGKGVNGRKARALKHEKGRKANRRRRDMDRAQNLRDRQFRFRAESVISLD